MTIAPVMMDLVGLELLPEEREMLQHPYVGGVILFTRNYATPDQVKQLIHTIRQAKKMPLSIAVDQEGGRVQRFKEPLTLLPPVRSFGELYEHSAELACGHAEETGYQMALELIELGIDMSFAPVLDLDWQMSEVIGNRSFHADPAVVVLLAGAFMRGMRRAGMPAVGKHFPGHGWVKADSHTDLPTDTRDWETLWHYDIRPFKELILQGLDGIMPAHVIYSACDVYPAGFSSFWLQTVLRGKLAFKGMVYSDDLTMAGASVMGNIIDRAKAALIAGCNQILICNQPQSVVDILDEPHLLD